VYFAYCDHIFNNDNVLATIKDAILFAAGLEVVVADINILVEVENFACRCRCRFRGDGNGKHRRRRARREGARSSGGET
jgi:hypothetical protein